MNPEPNYEVLSELTPADLSALTPEQEHTLDALRQWLIDYNFGKAAKPTWPLPVQLLISSYSQLKIKQAMSTK